MTHRQNDDQPLEGDAPIGGDENTEQQMEADNSVEEDMMKTLDPDDSPA